MNNPSMALEPKQVKRTYDATRRAAAAARTRQSILEAARTLFAENGYSATSMAAIAQAAGVALDTVYASAGRQPGLGPAPRRTPHRGTPQSRARRAAGLRRRDPRRPRRGHEDQALRGRH